MKQDEWPKSVQLLDSGKYDDIYNWIFLIHMNNQ